MNFQTTTPKSAPDDETTDISNYEDAEYDDEYDEESSITSKVTVAPPTTPKLTSAVS